MLILQMIALWLLIGALICSELTDGFTEVLSAGDTITAVVIVLAWPAVYVVVGWCLCVEFIKDLKFKWRYRDVK